jgi:hypothetical protein
MGRVLILGGWLLLAACSGGGHPANGPVGEALDKLDYKLPPEAEFLMLVPLEGCGKCAEACVAFSKQHLGNRKIVFAVVSGMGPREPRIRYSAAERQAPNLVLDGQGAFLRGGVIGGEVTLLHLEQGRVVFKEVFRPETLAPRLVRLAQELE